MRSFKILSEDTLFEHRSPRNIPANRLETIEEGYNPLSALKNCVEVTAVHSQRRVISIEELIPPILYGDDEAFSLLRDFYGDEPQFKSALEALELAKAALIGSNILPGLNILTVTIGGEKRLQIQLDYAGSPIGRFLTVSFEELPTFRENSMECLVAFSRFIVTKSSDLF